MENVYSYADVLESYMIAEEGFGDAIKKAGKFIGKALLSAIQFIKKAIQAMINKIRQIASRKNSKKESKKDVIARLEKENEAKASKIKMLEDALRGKDTELSKKSEEVKLIKSTNEFIGKHNDELSKRNVKLSEKKERATQMIAKLKKEIARNEEIKAKMDEDFLNKNEIEQFKKVALSFVAHVSTQVNKAYTALPKLISSAKKFDNTNDDDERIWKFLEEIESSLPTMSSGSWSSLYKKLKYNMIPEVKKDKSFIEWSGALGRSFEILIKQSLATVEYLEKMVKDISDESKTNKVYKSIISGITKSEGFIDMLKHSISLSNEILSCFEMHNELITHTIHDAV